MISTLARRAALCLGLALLSCAACAAKAPEDPVELRIQAERFIRQLELKAYNRAMESVLPSHRAQFLQYTQELGERTTINEARVASVDVPTEEEQDALPDDVPLEATIIVSWKIFQLPSTEVHDEVKTQTWRFVETRQRWFIVEGW